MIMRTIFNQQLFIKAFELAHIETRRITAITSGLREYEHEVAYRSGRIYDAMSNAIDEIEAATNDPQFYDELEDPESLYNKDLMAGVI